MADLAAAGPIHMTSGQIGPNRLTLALLAGVVAAGGVIANDLTGGGASSRFEQADIAPFGVEGDGAGGVGVPGVPTAMEGADRAAQAVVSPSSPSAPGGGQGFETDLLLDMGPELRSAFDTVLRGKSLLDGEKPQDMDGELLREKASAEIGYALRATPEASHDDGSDHVSVNGGAPWVITGKPDVLSGDRLRINDILIDLHGIRSPESEDICRNAGGVRYDCAAWSQEALSAAISSRNVSCDVVGSPDPTNPMAGWCHLHMAGQPAIDIAGWMISAGAALVTEDGQDNYEGLQKKARAERRGLWSGSLGLPDEAKPGQPR